LRNGNLPRRPAVLASAEPEEFIYHVAIRRHLSLI